MDRGTSLDLGQLLVQRAPRLGSWWPQCSRSAIDDPYRRSLGNREPEAHAFTEHLRFIANGVEYDYRFRHEYLTEGMRVHLARYFGERCDRGDALGPEDREGIAAGRVSPGMTKAGVIKAIGYPPPHATPELSSRQWRYWRNRFDTFIVHFEGESVAWLED